MSAERIDRHRPAPLARAAAAGVPWLAQVYGDGAIQLTDAKEARPPVVCDDVSAAADALSKLVRTSDDVEVAVRAGIAAGAGIARALAADDHHDKTLVPYVRCAAPTAPRRATSRRAASRRSRPRARGACASSSTARGSPRCVSVDAKLHPSGRREPPGRRRRARRRRRRPGGFR